MREALRRVKETIGEDAIIVEERKAGAGVELVVTTQQRMQSTLETPVESHGEKAPPKVAVLELTYGQRLRQLGFSDAWSSDFAAHRGTWRTCLQQVVAHIPIHCDALDFRGVLRLVGPCGAGKTATLLKLMTSHVGRWGSQSLAVVSQRQQRIGSTGELALACRLLDVPFTDSMPVDSELHTHLVAGSGRRKLVLIDTDAEALAGPLKVPGVTLLVCPATQQTQLYDFYERRYASGELSGIVLTHTDQAILPGVSLEAAARLALDVWLLGTGTHLPDDLVPASQEHLFATLKNFAPGRPAERQRRRSL
jgi:flagellar biosynthesis protein FlhF